MTPNPENWRFCVAPMLDWTDTHCRAFHRSLTRHARLYTEMITTPALVYGRRDFLLRHNKEENPVACQLGGSDPIELAQAARWVQEAGYDEVNLNCGCPSERVQKGSFGACLMLEPALVADCWKAMRDAVDIDVTIKHRIGVDENDSYAFVSDFVGTLYEAGCRVFIVHTRSAWLKGLSPKENREVPPLKREYAARLKKDFPEAVVCINGGIDSVQLAEELIAGPGSDRLFVLGEIGRHYFDTHYNDGESGLLYHFNAEVRYAHQEFWACYPWVTPIQYQRSKANNTDPFIPAHQFIPEFSLGLTPSWE